MLTYRREIDGLRALAVLPVLLFHAGFELFGGGFVGVDVFFVISGYLITSIILAEKQAGRFSLIGFYERRARRILPALFFVVLACVPFAWFWMLPMDLKEFSQSMMAVPLFASNILFWMQSDYFDTAAELKPLLHTWSLAVEEQYYVLFPLFLLLTWQLRKRWLIGMLAVAAIVSLLLAQWGSLHKPSATFYLLPTRGWELLVGVFIAFHQFRNPHPANAANSIAQPASLIGLLLIAFSIFAFDKNTPFPSLYALVPTLGTALIILFAHPQTLAGKILGSKLPVAIGLLSYSAYLWHQPLLAFARLRSDGPPNNGLLLALIAGSLILAQFSLKYVEQPFRDRQRVGRRSVFGMGALVSALILVLGFWGVSTNGFDQRLSPEQRELLSYARYDIDKIYRHHGCYVSSTKRDWKFSPDCTKTTKASDGIFLWGDSHAAALSNGLRTLMPDTDQYTAGACPPLIGINIASAPYCKEINRFVLGEIARTKPKSIVLHANWSSYFKDSRSTNADLSITQTLDGIRKASPLSKIYLLGGVPQWSPSLLVAMTRSGLTLNRDAYIHTPMLPHLRSIDDRLLALALDNGVAFVSSLDRLCANDSCQAVAAVHGRFEPTAFDYGHLTEAGSHLLANKVLAQISATHQDAEVTGPAGPIGLAHTFRTAIRHHDPIAIVGRLRSSGDSK